MGDDRDGRAGRFARARRRIVDAVERHPLLTRWLLAGPGALVGACLIMAAMPVWLPAGAAGIDNIIYPIVLAPLIWTVAFLYAVLEPNLARGVAVTSGVILTKGLVVTLAVTGLIHGGGA